MSLISKIPAILKHIEANQGRLSANKQTFDLIDGEILPLIYAAIDRQLSGESAKIAKDRVPPINILRKIIKKLSTIYSSKPTRDAGKDQALLDSWVDELGIDSIFAETNEAFNAAKYGVAEIYADKAKRTIGVRPCELDAVLPYSDDPINPARMTVMIKFMGEITKRKDGLPINGKETSRQLKQSMTYLLYSDDEIIYIDSDGDVLHDQMAAMGIESGVNDFGVIPFGFIQRSRTKLLPKRDDDIISMSVLIPLLMGEGNFAMMFLSNPIIYGVDVDTKDLQMSPLSFWSVSSNGAGNGKLEVLRPDMNIEALSKWIKDQLTMWLETKNIKAKGLSSVESGSVASGIALILEEMDTSEDRANQIPFFVDFEADFWWRFGKIHNILSQGQEIDELRKFSNNLIVKTTFAPTKIVEDSTQKEGRINASVQASTRSIESAVRELHPNWSNAEIEREVALIKEERSGRVQAQTQA